MLRESTMHWCLTRYTVILFTRACNHTSRHSLWELQQILRHHQLRVILATVPLVLTVATQRSLCDTLINRPSSAQSFVVNRSLSVHALPNLFQVMRKSRPQDVQAFPRQRICRQTKNLTSRYLLRQVVQATTALVLERQ